MKITPELVERVIKNIAAETQIEVRFVLRAADGIDKVSGEAGAKLLARYLNCELTEPLPSR